MNNLNNDSISQKLKILRAAINRYHNDASGKWRRDSIEKHEMLIDEVLPTLKKWKKLGFIKIVDMPECFFETLKYIPDNWETIT